MRIVAVSLRTKKIISTSWAYSMLFLFILLLFGIALDALGYLHTSRNQEKFYVRTWKQSQKEISEQQYENIETLRMYYIIALCITGGVAVLTLIPYKFATEQKEEK